MATWSADYGLSLSSAVNKPANTSSDLEQKSQYARENGYRGKFRVESINKIQVYIYHSAILEIQLIYQTLCCTNISFVFTSDLYIFSRWEVIWTDPPAPVIRSNGNNNKSSLSNNETDSCNNVQLGNQQRTADDELEEEEDEDGMFRISYVLKD